MPAKRKKQMSSRVFTMKPHGLDVWARSRARRWSRLLGHDVGSGLDRFLGQLSGPITSPAPAQAPRYLASALSGQRSKKMVREGRLNLAPGRGLLRIALGAPRQRQAGYRAIPYLRSRGGRIMEQGTANHARHRRTPPCGNSHRHAICWKVVRIAEALLFASAEPLAEDEIAAPPCRRVVSVER